MTNNLYSFDISTEEKQTFITIDDHLQQALSKSGVKNGIMVVFCPHTTAGITINENGDSDVKKDLILGLNQTFPNKAEYRHMEGNSDAHIKSSVVGASETLIILKGRLILGTWQSLYFCEFDGPRNRNFFVKIIEG
ncbi:secondary thiamine-phosphate synthase enzyme YjbQ [Carnobacterium pleistocenium]|uniref:secondary thiamine-phosphate synthase enzyme YjbQ n=1 Tax=Carnobacterium pleistocenium TaxID=181073 RepID=UPI00054EFBC1|nr:secondary thiamine-phosphate synthase enzyme YjbQ [Carnobacterium pleistocenium]